MKNNDTAVIIPVYNEGQVIKKVVENVLKTFPIVVCVIDGGTDNSYSEVAKTSAQVVEHPINMGQGAALQTGIEQALKNPKINYFITFDADGQHSIKDAEKMLKEIKKEKLDVVLGSRFLGKVENMTIAKRIILKMAIGFTNVFSKVHLTDTHNGLRVFTRNFAQKLNIAAPDMVHASEIIDKLGKGDWNYKEVPITITYTDYSKAKGQSITNSINIVVDLFLTKGSRK